jgi:hypothetical protein
MIEKIPLLNSKSTLKKIIGIFVYSFLLLFVIGLIGSILDPVDRPAEIIDVDLGAYMVSFEKPWGYEAEIDPLSSEYQSWVCSPTFCPPAYRQYFRRIADKDDWLKMIAIYFYVFDEPQINKTDLLRDHLKLGKKYRIQNPSIFTSNQEYMYVKSDSSLGAGFWLDGKTMFTISTYKIPQYDFENILNTLNITELSDSAG